MRSRLAGEIGYQGCEPLALALAEAIWLDGGIVINMTGLSFIDTSRIRMILDAAAARLSAAGSGY